MNDVIASADQVALRCKTLTQKIILSRIEQPVKAILLWRKTL